MSQQALCKQVEVSTSLTFQVETAIDNVTVNPSQTLFPNAFALIADIDDQINTDWTGDRPYLCLGERDGLKGRAIIVNYDTDILSYSGTLLSQLGFTGSETSSTFAVGIITVYYIVATNPPLGVWYPSLHSSDANLWVTDTKSSFSGVTGVDGNISGVSYTVQKNRPAAWPAELAYNAFPESPGATAIQTASCFVQVLEDARAMSLVESGSGNKYCKGIYFIEDIEEYYCTFAEDVSVNMPTSWNSGSQVENYLFCGIKDPRAGANTFKHNKARYGLSLEMNTAIAPDWGWDIS